MEITKAQAITLLAKVFEIQREDGETDIQLVIRIRNEQHNEAKARIDNRLKGMAIAKYYESNPDARETVADLD